MNYKGAWSDSTDYEAGDVVVFTDNVAYVAVKNPPAGAIPHDTHFWNRVDQPLQETVIMFKGMFESIANSVPKNIDDEAITLKTETADYLITVDDSGDTPELEVTAIEEEGD